MAAQWHQESGHHRPQEDENENGIAVGQEAHLVAARFGHIFSGTMVYIGLYWLIVANIDMYVYIYIYIYIMIIYTNYPDFF